MLIEIDPRRPRPRQIKQVADIIRRGGIVIYPTDTCYGLGADIFNKKAIEKICLIKAVPRNTPFSFVCSDLSDISRYARVSDYAYRILKRFLPGPYTFVLEASRQVPKIMLTKRKTAGIRISDHPVSMLLAGELGNPIISTSAGVGDDIISDPRDICNGLDRHADIIIDSGVILPEPSSVISLVNDEPEVIREGQGDCSLFYET